MRSNSNAWQPLYHLNKRLRQSRHDLIGVVNDVQASAAARPDVSLLPSAHEWQLPPDALELGLPNVSADVVSASAAMAKKSLSRCGFARCES
jgi:hypothetical protein